MRTKFKIKIISNQMIKDETKINQKKREKNNNQKNKNQI